MQREKIYPLKYIKDLKIFYGRINFMENKVNYDFFPEEKGLAKELMILRSQEEMVQILLLEEIERDNQEKENESSFDLTNLPHTSSHPQ